MEALNKPHAHIWQSIGNRTAAPSNRIQFIHTTRWFDQYTLCDIVWRQMASVDGKNWWACGPGYKDFGLTNKLYEEEEFGK